jgi:hypothetical protein
MLTGRTVSHGLSCCLSLSRPQVANARKSVLQDALTSHRFLTGLWGASVADEGVRNHVQLYCAVNGCDIIYVCVM